MSPVSTTTRSASIRHQLVVAHGDVLAAEMRVQVDHDRAALHAVLGHGLDAQRAGLGAALRQQA
jgi:hypothetical protein